jgi:hypothetical protein
MASAEAERKAFLDMARTWTKAAAKPTNGQVAPEAAIKTPK